MLIKKEKIEDLEFLEVEPEDKELRSIVMEEEDNAKKKAEEEYDFEVKRAEKKRLKEAMKRVEVSGGNFFEQNKLPTGLRISGLMSSLKSMRHKDPFIRSRGKG